VCLEEFGVEHVATESTGVYWKPGCAFAPLDRGLGQHRSCALFIYAISDRNDQLFAFPYPA
jgi:hypothetical protein